MKELKLVIDANILVSAYSATGRINELWESGLASHQLMISPEIFAEVERTLRQAEFHLAPNEIKERLKDILERCVLVRPKTRFNGEIADEKDRHLANLALEVGAERILTGEAALKKSATIAGTAVMSFAEFVSQESRLAVKS